MSFTNRTSKTPANQVSENTKTAASSTGSTKYGTGKGAKNIRDTSNVFVATANDEVRIAPLEKQTSSVALNEFTDFLTSFNTGLADLMSGAKSVLDFTKNAISKIKEVKQKIDNKDWTGMLSSVTGGLTPMLKDLGVDASIIEKMQDINNIVVKVGSAYQRIDNTDWKDVNSILGLVSHFTKDNELFGLNNLGGQVASLLESINVLSSKGIPNLLSTFRNFEGLANDFNSLFDLSRRSYAYAERDSNLDLLSEIADIIGIEALLTIDGFIPQRFLENFKVSSKIKADPEAYRELYEKFLSTYGKITAGWLFTPDSAPVVQNALNGVTFMNASKDFHEMLRYFSPMPFSLTLDDLDDSVAKNIPFITLMQDLEDRNLKDMCQNTLTTATWVNNTQLSKAFKSVYDDYGI